MILMYPVKTYIQITQGYSSSHRAIDMGFCTLARWNNDNLVINKQLPYDGINHEIVAPANGFVTEVVNDYPTQDSSGNSLGNYVRINHGDGIITTHGHMVMGSIPVSVGDNVVQGQKIGNMGATGHATGVHLHTYITINGTRVNPLDYYYAFPTQALGSNIIDGTYRIKYYYPSPTFYPRKKKFKWVLYSRKLRNKML
jgi:hypothetical protein